MELYNSPIELKYWIGPYGIRVSNTIDFVIATDGSNMHYKSGRITQRISNRQIPKEEYIKKYAELNEDGFYYYKYTGRNIDYWSGPYGVRVPNLIDSIIAIDGINTQYKNGRLTKMITDSRLSKNTYMEKYAELKEDGFYYHKDSVNTIQELDYWIGPYDVRVPNKINRIVAEDGFNTQYKNGFTSKMILSSRILKETYMDKYTELKEDGHYYYVENKPNLNYWTGPYGILISNSINSVVARDGYNTQYKNIYITEKSCKNPAEISKDTYFTKYAELKEDGQYYYRKNLILK